MLQQNTEDPSLQTANNMKGNMKGHRKSDTENHH